MVQAQWKGFNVADLLAVVGGGSLLLGFCLLACPLMMVYMAWGMRRRQRNPYARPGTEAPGEDKDAELGRLRAEIDQLKVGDRASERRTV